MQLLGWALWLEIWVRALRDPQMAKEREGLDRRWAQFIAEVIRYGRQTGEFPSDGRDADELGLQFSAMTDGLAIQVLLNDTAMTPQRMYDICTEWARLLIGLDE